MSKHRAIQWESQVSFCGGVAQLGEHQLCKLGVAGSTPVASTKILIGGLGSCAF